MKNYKLILSLFISSLVFSQQENFVGVWEYQENNQIFRVTLWEYLPLASTSSMIKGNYELISVQNGIESIVYQSEKEMFPNSGVLWFPVISGGSTDGVKLTARIMDNTQYGANTINRSVNGVLTMIITDNTPSITAQWKIKSEDVFGGNFNIPLNITLSKVD